MENKCADMLSRQGVRLGTAEELAEAKGKAWSIGANSQPKDPEYIGSRRDGDNTYHYFKDTDGKFYFLSSRLLEFEKELEAGRARRKALHRYSRKK